MKEAKDDLPTGNGDVSPYDADSDTDWVQPFYRGFEDLPAGSQARYIIDFASSVLKSSDAIKNPQLKMDSLKKILDAWKLVLEWTEVETIEALKDIDIAGIVNSGAGAGGLRNVELEAAKKAFSAIFPCYLIACGVASSLASKSVHRILEKLYEDGVGLSDHQRFVELLMDVSLEGTHWIKTLSHITPTLLETTAVELAVSDMVRARYIIESDLSREQRETVEDFLCRVEGQFYNFSSKAQRDQHLSSYRDSIRQRRVREQTRLKERGWS